MLILMLMLILMPVQVPVPVPVPVLSVQQAPWWLSCRRRLRHS